MSSTEEWAMAETGPPSVRKDRTGRRFPTGFFTVGFSAHVLARPSVHPHDIAARTQEREERGERQREE